MATTASPARLRHPVIAMVVVSFCLQVAVVGLLHTYRFRTADDHFGFGWEMGKLAQSIAQGKGFANPYGVESGPSAWEPPVYPYLIAGVFQVFGIYTTASAWVLLIINCLFSALTCVPIYQIAYRCFGEKVARWSGWTWALLPYIVYWSVHWVWDTTISPFLLAVVFLAALELADGVGGWQLWVSFGLLWGVLALTNPSCLSFLPVCVGWVWWRRAKSRRASFPGLVLAGIVTILCITPWLVRNYEAFGRFVFLRDDFGAQLRLGNGPGAEGQLMPYLQPNLNPAAMRQFQQMGEFEYAQLRKREAFDWIRDNPGRFTVLSFRRFFYYWGGVQKPNDSLLLTAVKNSLYLASSVAALLGLALAVRKRKPAAWLFLLLVLSYPTVYYFVYPNARYRHPIEPELCILAVFLVSEAEKRGATVP